jgi:hypothetical protein
VATESSGAPPRRANYAAIRARSDFRAFRRSSTVTFRCACLFVEDWSCRLLTTAGLKLSTRLRSTLASSGMCWCSLAAASRHAIPRQLCSAKPQQTLQSSPIEVDFGFSSIPPPRHDGRRRCFSKSVGDRDASVKHRLPNSDVAADEALGRCAPSGPRSLMPVVGQTGRRTESWPLHLWGYTKRHRSSSTTATLRVSSRWSPTVNSAVHSTVQ